MAPVSTDAALLPEPSASSVLSVDSAKQVSVDSTVASGTVITELQSDVTTFGNQTFKKDAARTVLLRQSKEEQKTRSERVEPEVARGVCSSEGLLQDLTIRGGIRNPARLSMKCSGTRLAEFTTTGGSGLSQDAVDAAADRSQRRRFEKEKERLETEAAKAADRAAKMAARRAKAKNTQLRHELRIHESEAKKAALKEQAENDKDVLRDIVRIRQKAERSLAERELLDDSLEQVLRWAIPDAHPGFGDAAGQINDEEAVLRLLKGGRPGQAYPGSGLHAAEDSNAVLRLIKGQLPTEAYAGARGATEPRRDEDAVLRLMGQGGDNVRDDEMMLGFMGKGSGKGSDEDVVMKLVGRGGPRERVGDDGTVRRLLSSRSGEELFRPVSRGESIHDSETMLRLMSKGLRDDDMVQNWLHMAKHVGDGPSSARFMKARAAAAKDDNAFRLILDSAATRDEAKVNADALRFILGGTADPVTRLAHLARSRPKAGRSREHAEAAQAARDLHVLNGMLEKTDCEMDILAWKDVGAIHMLMNDLPGPEPEQRRKMAKKLQNDREAADTDALKVLMATPRPLLPSQDNSLQPPTTSSVQPPLTSSVALKRLVGPPSQLVNKDQDTATVQQLMSPLGRTSLPQKPVDADINIVNQLMSPKGGVPPSSVQFNQLMSPAGGYGGLPSSMAPAPLAQQDAAVTRSLMGMNGYAAQAAAPLAQQDAAVARGLMGMNGYAANPAASDAQTMRDVDRLRALLI